MTVRLKRVPYSGSTDSQIVNSKTGEDIGRISGEGKGAVIAYPDDVAKQIVKAVNNRKTLISQLDEWEERFDSLRKDARKMHKQGTIDLKHLSRSPDRAFTHVRFEDFELREVFSLKDDEGRKSLVNWLEFGTADLRNDNASFLGARLGNGVTDWEHDSAYLVHIGLIGIKFTGTYNNCSHFEAHLTTQAGDIKVWTPDFKPAEAEGVSECEHEHCDQKHLMIEAFTPPMYEFAHLVAGKKVAITMGVNWRTEDE